MDNHSISTSSSSPKLSRSSSSSSSNSNSSFSSANNGVVKTKQPLKLHQGVRSKLNDFFQKAYRKPATKEGTKPVEIKLHTQQRAVKRAGFNYLVECKMTMIEHQRQQEERFRKMIEEEEIRMLRKEMIPRAQLMPLFDRPFFPQRSTRPLTVPREPSFHSKSWRCMSARESYNFERLTHQASKPIK